MAKIIIAEDELSSRLILSRIVEGLGHCAIQASQGDRALSILEDNSDCQLVITDMEMPGMGGRELVTRIQKNDRLQKLPIIIVSGVVSLREIDDLLKRGASRFMPKPIVVEELKEYIRLLLNSAKQSVPSQSALTVL